MANLNARLDGNLVVATVRCGGRPAEGAKLWLSSSLTDSAVDRAKRDQLLAAAGDDPDAQMQATGKMKGVTNADGQATFDLSNVQAGAGFSDARARIDFYGEFESGKKIQQGDQFVSVDLSGCPQYPSWQAQATAQKAGADTRRGPPLDLDAKKAECSAGKGESCYTVAIGMCWPDWRPGDAEPANLHVVACYRVSAQSQALVFFHKACALHYQPACARETRIQADEADARVSQQGQTAGPQGAPSFTREISNTNPLQQPLTILPGQTITASFTTTQDNARLSCDFRSLGQTNQAQFDHSNGGQGKPCNVAVANHGAFALNIVLVCATNYGGHPITVRAAIQRQ